MTRLATPQDAARWLHQRVRGVLRTDSRRVAAGDGFIAWPGAAADGRRFVADALAQGATACVVEHEGAMAPPAMMAVVMTWPSSRLAA